MNKYILPSIMVVGIFLMGAITVVNLLGQPRQADASVTRFAEYQGTTTSTGNFAVDQLVQTGPGTLGSIVITGAAAGTINIYDATTSNITLRAPSMSSSTILKATMPVSAAANTYTFDVLLSNGLFVNTVGTMPTTTITYRPN